MSHWAIFSNNFVRKNFRLLKVESKFLQRHLLNTAITHSKSCAMLYFSGLDHCHQLTAYFTVQKKSETLLEFQSLLNANFTSDGWKVDVTSVVWRHIGSNIVVFWLYSKSKRSAHQRLCKKWLTCHSVSVLYWYASIMAFPSFIEQHFHIFIVETRFYFENHNSTTLGKMETAKSFRRSSSWKVWR